MKKLRVGILFGGRSGEHEVSLLSAASVLGAIDKSKYEVVPIGITKEGRWLTSAEAEKLLNGKTPEHEARHLRAGDPETLLLLLCSRPARRSWFHQSPKNPVAPSRPSRPIPLSLAA